MVTRYQSKVNIPLDIKIKMTERRIREFSYQVPCYCSVSGGKDSTVLDHLTPKNIPRVFVDTGLEYPGVRENALRLADVVLRPDMNFKAIIEKYGFPFPSKEQAQYIYEYRTTKSEKLKNLRLNGDSFKISKKWQFLCDSPYQVSHKCCHIMKKRPIHKYEKQTGLKPITGQRADESNLRMQQYNKDGCAVFTEGKERCNPLSFWTDKDIHNYIKQEGLVIPPEYEYLNRTGCMFCMFGLARDGTPNRFDKMKEHNPRQYAYCMNNLGIEEFMKYLEENGVL